MHNVRLGTYLYKTWYLFIIINLLHVDKFDAKDRDLLSVGAMDSVAAISNPKIRVAVISNDEDILNLFTSYEEESAGSPWKVKYFSSVNHANKWLLA